MGHSNIKQDMVYKLHKNAAYLIMMKYGSKNQVIRIY